jgi:hypothetical protein
MIKKAVKEAMNCLGYSITRKPTRPRLDLSRISNTENLVAGPFLGEFGWELMQWQGYVRRLAKFYKTTTVYGRSSSSYFYEDFATQYIALDNKSWDTNGYELHSFDYGEWAADFKVADLLVADNRCLDLRATLDQEFIPFGQSHPADSYDIVVHARSIPLLDGNSTKHLRNWARNRWDELCLNLPQLRIAAVGVPGLSYCPASANDLRGIDTKRLCSVLASSKVCIGPSSGLMHLASLCKTPHLVWFSKECNHGDLEYRYIRSWNPFATKVRVLTDGGWDPKPEYVRQELFQFLKIIERETAITNEAK